MYWSDPGSLLEEADVPRPKVVEASGHNDALGLAAVSPLVNHVTDAAYAVRTEIANEPGTSDSEATTR